MTPVPFELPLKPNEAASLADLLFQQLDGKPLTEDQRGRFAGRLNTLATPTIAVYAGSLSADPIHASTYYLAVDGLHHNAVTPLLLRIAPSSAAATGVFPKSLMIGRVRPHGQREVVISAVPFDAGDADNVRAFVENIDKAFLPRALGAQPVHIVRTSSTAGLQSAFESFRALPKQTLVAVETDHFWRAVWAAIRAGRRDGYGLGVCLPSSDSLRAVEEAPLFTKYVIAGRADVSGAIAVIDHVRRVKSGLANIYTRTVDFELAVQDAAELAPALAALKAQGRNVHSVSAAHMASAETTWEEIRSWNVPLVVAGSPSAGIRASVRTTLD